MLKNAAFSDLLILVRICIITSWYINTAIRIHVQQLTLMKNAMTSNSKARSFYLHMMRKAHSVNNGNLFLRCNNICKSHGLSLSRYLFDEHYMKRCKTLVYSETCDGVADSISALLTNYKYNSKMLIKQFLSPYQLTP